MVPREDALRACQYAAMAKGKRGEAALLRIADGFVTAYNEEMYAACKIPIEGEFCVDAVKIIKCLESHTDVEVNVEAKDTHVIIRGRGWRYQAQIEPAGPWYGCRRPSEWAAVGDSWSAALSVVGRAASRIKTAQPKLKCVFFSKDKMEAFDGGQYAVATVGSPLSASAVVPWEYLKRIDGIGVTHIAIDGGFLHMRTVIGVHIAVRVWDSTYPDLSPLLKWGDAPQEILLPVALKEEAALVVKQVQTRDTPITVRLQAGHLMMRATSEDHVTYARKVGAPYTGEPYEFHVGYSILELLASWGRLHVHPWQNGQDRLVYRANGLTCVALTHPQSSWED